MTCHENSWDTSHWISCFLPQRLQRGQGLENCTVHRSQEHQRSNNAGKIKIWWFPKMGVLPIIHSNMCFRFKPSSYWGTPILGTPHMQDRFCLDLLLHLQISRPLWQPSQPLSVCLEVFTGSTGVSSPDKRYCNWTCPLSSPVDVSWPCRQLNISESSIGLVGVKQKKCLAWNNTCGVAGEPVNRLDLRPLPGTAQHTHLPIIKNVPIVQSSTCA